MGAITQFAETMNKVFYYIGHPKEAGLVVWGFVDFNSYYLCMVICLVAVLLYLCGWEKGKKYAVNSTIVFILIKAIGTAFK